MSEPGEDSKGFAAILGGAGLPVEQVKKMITETVSARPELAVAGAFAGGLIVAMIARRLGN